jgi:hypothetical protein
MLEDERVQQAVTKVAVLESRLNGHEDICAERYAEIFTQLKNINGSIRGALIALVMLLLGALGTVVFTGVKGMQAETVRE